MKIVLDNHPGRTFHAKAVDMPKGEAKVRLRSLKRLRLSVGSVATKV